MTKVKPDNSPPVSQSVTSHQSPYATAETTKRNGGQRQNLNSGYEFLYVRIQPRMYRMY